LSVIESKKWDKRGLAGEGNEEGIMEKNAWRTQRNVVHISKEEFWGYRAGEGAMHRTKKEKVTEGTETQDHFCK